MISAQMFGKRGKFRNEVQDCPRRRGIAFYAETGKITARLKVMFNLSPHQFELARVNTRMAWWRVVGFQALTIAERLYYDT